MIGAKQKAYLSRIPKQRDKNSQQGRTELTNPIQDCKKRITCCSALAGRP